MHHQFRFFCVRAKNTFSSTYFFLHFVDTAMNDKNLMSDHLNSALNLLNKKNITITHKCERTKTHVIL